MVFKWRWCIHNMTLEMTNHLVGENGGYRSTGNDPQFILHSSRRKLPRRWVSISYHAEGQNSNLKPVLYIDNGHGFSEQRTLFLPAGNGQIEAIVRLPDYVKSIRLDPPFQTDLFYLRDIKIVQLSKLNVIWKLAQDKLKKKPITKERVKHLTGQLLKVWKEQGWHGLKNYIISYLITQPRNTFSNYDAWIKSYDELSHSDRVRIRERIEAFRDKPLISVIMPVYNTHEKWLRLAIDSVLCQIYPNWELCIADDASTIPDVRRILEEYKLKDSRIKVTFRKKNGHISAASNSALALATGQWIALLDHDDELSEHALYMVAEEINAHPQLGLIYSDEDRINEQGDRYNPYFKSDWNPDLFLSHNLVSHLGVYKTSLVREIGGFREGFEGSQDYDLALRTVERLTSYQIRHIPHILYHWRAIEGSVAGQMDAKVYAYEAARKAIQDHLDRQQIFAYVTTAYNYNMNRVIYKLPQILPKVSVIIPTKDKLDLLQVSVKGVLEKTDYPNLELIIVNNQSQQQDTLAYLHKLDALPTVKVISYDLPYNYSAINNLAVTKAAGDVLAFVNNDIEVISPDWLKEMVAHALRPDVGAVGALLYYINNTIQHAGVVLCSDVALHAHQFLGRGNPGYHGKANLLQNYSAVTAACMVLRRTVFEKIKGFDEKNLPVTYNDVDLCLRIQEKGYRILWTPYAELYHHESATLGSPKSPERFEQFLKEAEYLKTRWSQLIQHDPFYSPNLTLSSGDFSLAFPPRLRKPWQAHQQAHQ